MKTERYYCGVCHKKVDTQADCSNEISARNGKWHFFADDVCDTCVAKIGKVIEDLGGELKQDNELHDRGQSQSG